MPEYITSGLLEPGVDYDLIWAVGRIPFPGNLAAGTLNGLLRSRVDAAVVGQVFVPKGYPLVFADRHLFRVSIRQLQSASESVEQLLNRGERILFGLEGIPVLPVPTPVQEFILPDDGRVYPTPIALVYRPNEATPEERAIDLTPVYLIGGVAIAGSLIGWGAYILARRRRRTSA